MLRLRAPLPSWAHDRLRFVFTLLVLLALFQIAAALIPLPPQPDLTLASTFGTHDNRRLLLHYAGLVLAVLLAPWLSKPLLALTPRAEASRSWRRAALFALPFAAVGAWMFLGPGIAMNMINGHEVVHVGYLSQMQHGAVLNVDTFMNYGPLLGMSIFGFMKVVGFHMVGFRTYWHVAALLTWILTALWVWRSLRSTVLVLVFLIYALLFTAMSWFLPDGGGIYHAAWGWANPLRHGAPVLAVAFLGPSLLSGRRAAAVIAGTLVTAFTLYAQETGPPAFVALAMLVLLGGWSHRTPRSQLLAFGTGLVLMIPVVCLPALLRGEIVSFLRATFEAPRIVIQGAANRPFPELGTPHFWPYYLLPALGLGLLLLHGSRVRAGSREDAVPAALAAYASIAFVTVLVRADQSHWQNVALPFWMLLFLSIDRAYGTTVPLRHRLLKAGLAIAILSLPVFLLPPGINRLPQALGGRSGAPSPPAGWIKLDLERAGIWVPGDRWFEGKPEKRGSTGAVVMIRDLTRGRPTQILGNPSSLYYFLSDARAAVPYTDLITQCVSEYHRRRLVAAYFRSKPEYTFIFKEFESNPPRPATGYRRLGDSYGLAVYQREDLEPVTLPSE